MKVQHVLGCTRNVLFAGSSLSIRSNNPAGLWNHTARNISMSSTSVCSLYPQFTLKRNLSTFVPRNEEHVSWTTKRSQDGRDRTRKIPVELSMAYLDSAGYKETYGDKKVWELYRRNLPGRYIHVKTRKSCIIDGRIETGNPCPICRDEYLVVDYRNIKLLKQFLTDYNGQVLNWNTANLCQEQYKNLRVAIEKARDYGLLEVDAHFVEYDYTKYMTNKSKDSL